MLKRLFGVPLDASERHALLISYVRRLVEQLQKAFPDKAYTELSGPAKQQITVALDEYLNQIAARSQTLLAVVALLISAFLAIGTDNQYIKSSCLLWAASALSLFYNIWLFFGAAEAYSSPHKEYAQTVRLAFVRSTIFYANIICSALFSLLCTAIYMVQKS